jgi:hypothetical protein
VPGNVKVVFQYNANSLLAIDFHTSVTVEELSPILSMLNTSDYILNATGKSLTILKGLPQANFMDRIDTLYFEESISISQHINTLCLEESISEHNISTQCSEESISEHINQFITNSDKITSLVKAHMFYSNPATTGDNFLVDHNSTLYK